MDAKTLTRSVTRTLMFIAGILGNNWLAIRSLLRQKSSIHTNEILFINLAVSNLITNYLVDLPDTMADFAGRWFLGETYCGVFRFCTGLSETSSIFTTLFISAFWHQKLVGSLKRGSAPGRMDSLWFVGCLLAGNWTAATVFNVPHFFFVTVEGENGSCEKCVDVFPNEIARQTYEAIYLTLASVFPTVGIVFASAQIVITLLQDEQRIRSHNSDQIKEIVKEEKSLENKRGNASVSIVSGPSKDSTSPNPAYTGVPAPSYPNRKLSGHGRHSSPQNKVTDTDYSTGAQPNLSRSSHIPPNHSPSTNVRAAKSVVAVACVVLLCGLTHFLLRIINDIHPSSIVLEVSNYVAASYMSIIPYIFLHFCSCRS